MNNPVIPVREEHHSHAHSGNDSDRACMSRRQFLLSGGALVTLAVLPGCATTASAGGQASVGAQTLQALKASYPRQKVGSLSALKAGVPVEFAYPYPDVHNLLVKLGAPAGGGIGKDLDVVAFNQQCTHMGMTLQGSYKAQHQVLGPCPLHLTTFDLTRHGMVVCGHAVESLPQIVLETQGDDIYAVGVMGLIFGHASNTDRA
ncbi:MAG: arsenate reductase (azurin) small subunit [Pseudomonadota bacterium]|nr:arsenate reductase (azurin) small subunit [Pseudomonadota bacterium]MDP2352611.1 arsenate reductase (azurin) small subunit [Pseudomonadota bacterium]